MSAYRREIQPAGERIYVPRPSWAPAVFAFAAALAVVGIFAGFMVRGLVYSIVGLIVVLAAFRSLVGRSVRDYLRLPRQQRVRGAVLPVETISAPPLRQR